MMAVLSKNVKQLNPAFIGGRDISSIYFGGIRGFALRVCAFLDLLASF